VLVAFCCVLFDRGFDDGYFDEVVVVFVFILLALTFSRLESGFLSLGLRKKGVCAFF